MDDIKVLCLIDSLGPGGAQNQMSLIAASLKEHGIEVSLLTYFSHDFFEERLAQSGVNRYKLNKTGKLGFRLVKQIVDIVKSNNYTHIVSMLNTPNFYASLAKKFCKDVKLIVGYRAHIKVNELSFSMRSRLKWINNTADLLIFNSFHEKKNWINHFPHLEPKTATIYNKVDLEKFNPILNNDKFKSEKLNIICIGTLSYFKNPKLIIKALAQIDFDYSFKWIGRKLLNNDATSEKYLNAIQAEIDDNNLSEKWEWIKPTTEIQTYYLNADCLILASKSEGLPNVVCEAMASGTPVVISDVLDHPILVENNVNGYRFDPNDPISLVDALAKIQTLKIDNNLLSFSENARKKAESLFSKDATTLKFINQITSM